MGKTDATQENIVKQNKRENAMLNQRITFDLFIRGLIVVAIIVLSIFMVGRLSTVLIPFFVAWLLAYMLYPLVCFLQYKARLRSRILSIVAALLVVFSVITGLLVLVIPPPYRSSARSTACSTSL